MFQNQKSRNFFRFRLGFSVFWHLYQLFVLATYTMYRETKAYCCQIQLIPLKLFFADSK